MVVRDKGYALLSERDDGKRREQERKALRMLRELEELDGEPGKATLVDLDPLFGPMREGSRVEHAFSQLPWTRTSHATFDDFRTIGLREVLARLRDRSLRRATVASADREVASRVMRTSNAPSDRGRAMWRVAERRAATLYRHAQDRGEVATDDPIVDEALARSGRGVPLPASLRAQMERELGISLAHVRVHTDPVAAAAAKAVRAHAFTVGEDIFFAEGAYAPDSPAGRKLLAHELAHVVQAHQGRTSTGGSGVRVSDPSEALEREADAIAERVLQAPLVPPRRRQSRSRYEAPRDSISLVPARTSSMLMRKATSRVADDAPFKMIGARGNHTKWRLRSDDVFVLASGPDGRRDAMNVTVSATRNPERWDALGKTWAAAAPGRTWPRPTQPRKQDAPSAPLAHSGPDTDRETTPLGIKMALGDALKQVPSLPLQILGLPTAGASDVYFDLHPFDEHYVISAPVLYAHGVSAGALYVGTAALTGLVIDATPNASSAKFTSASLDGVFVMVGRKKIEVEHIMLRGCKVGLARDGIFGAGLHFDEAQITGIRYPGAPPADLVLTNSTFLALVSSLETSPTHSTAEKQHDGKPGLPSFPDVLAGTRVKAKLEGLGGTHVGVAGSTASGGFTRFEAQLVKDGEPDALASIAIEGASVYRSGSHLQGQIKRIHVTGSADFVLALLDSPALRAQKDVADVLDEATKTGIVPTVGTQLTLENVQLGMAGSSASARTDIMLEVAVPGSMKLRMEVLGLEAAGDATETTHADFRTLLIVLSDGRGPIVALMAEGSADKRDKQIAAMVRQVHVTGDISRLTKALRTVKLPPKVDAVLASVKKHVSLEAGVSDVDVTMNIGDEDKELRGDAKAHLKVPGVGSVELSVVGFHGDGNIEKKSGSLAFDRFEARVTRKKSGDAATLIITGAHATTGSDKHRASADMIDLRGNAGKSADILAAIDGQVAALPPMLREAVSLVRSLDLGATAGLSRSSKTSPDSITLPDAGVATNAHVALAIPRVGTIDATIRGFSADTKQDGPLDINFETLEVSLLTTAGKRAARIVVRGGGGWVHPGNKVYSAGDLNAHLDDVTLEGNTRGLLQALDPNLFATAPQSIRTGLELLRAHQVSLATTVDVHATELAVGHIDGNTNATLATITARVEIPGGVATATLRKGEAYTVADANTLAAGFDLLEVTINDDAATLRILDGQWTSDDATGTAARIDVTGNGSKLLAILDKKILAQLPPDIGTALRRFSAFIVTATATNVSVQRKGDGAIAKIPSLDLSGEITFVDGGKTYKCEHASIRVFGAEVEGSADAQTITAERAQIAGHFEQIGGGRTRGMLVVNTGATKLTQGGGLVAHDIRAQGWLDVEPAKQPEPESENQLKTFDDTVEVAKRNTPLLRSLELDLHVPLDAGTYGELVGRLAPAGRVRVSPDTMFNLHVGISERVVTALVVSISGEISVMGTKLRRLAFERQELTADVTGVLSPLIDVLVERSNAMILFGKVAAKFDTARIVRWAAAAYRKQLRTDLADKGGLNWADEERLEREEQQLEAQREQVKQKADLDERKSVWSANPKREAADEPKAYGELMKDLNPGDINGTLRATIGRPRAIDSQGEDVLSGYTRIAGSFTGTTLQLAANAAVYTGEGTAKVDGMDTGPVTASETSTGGKKVTFDSFRIQELSWTAPKKPTRSSHGKDH